MKQILSILTMLGAASPAFADDWPDKVSRFFHRDPTTVYTIATENDFFGDRDDRWYTYGGQLRFLLEPRNTPRWLGKFVGYGATGPHSRVELSMGSMMFTPELLRATNVQFDDRPYASWAYLGANALTLSSGQTPFGGVLYVDRVGLDLGIIGLDAFGENQQNQVHTALGAQKGEGWRHQLPLEPTIDLHARRRVHYIRDLGPLEYDIAPHVGGSIGTVDSYLSAGLTVRIGDGLPMDISSRMDHDTIMGAGWHHALDGVSWSLFAGIEGRAVLYDAFLDGGFFRGGHSVDKRNLVWEAHVGGSLTYRNTRLEAVYVMPSKTFDAQDEAQRYGAITLSFKF